MENRLFENTIHRTLVVGNGKEFRYLIVFSGLVHVLVLVVWFSFTPPNKPPVRFSDSVSSLPTPVFLKNIKPPPPPLPPRPKPRAKNSLKKLVEQKIETPKEVKTLSIPIEAPEKIKPEPTKLKEKTEDDTASDYPGAGEGVPGGIPGGVPGGTVGQNPSSGSLPKGPVEVKGNPTLLKRIKYVHPEYPINALRARIEGMVIVEALIGKNGKIKNVRIVQLVPFLDSAALEAVKKWEYEPVVVDGEVREVILTVTINFKIV
ncbi:MAG: hypothetical protein A2915_00545 [Candidatus Yanofskybacteria bacterium RIFCSPLOWO2_01_FULL_41_34]|uniref:TonB C-terminal domain-containing protein n=1 Tax=Candidatus Yanofskybacteria bacterium RIFCSPHIGHO2_01_FULL_41_26 TaxID=1802661 RepID=A0A1F8EDL3_9BACT|nr:MAG: hypothetical protein A2649_02575 [Candidatus Yanofskybacteria bacterium RIFCSPHIGHO2_01_FULL_41_26]OGN22387.1 MAG: hypothetical protein A2915_00545 [Candidatus Yanofskybacteria bacterium RIFCSPLOWO2_01_FULL_41_34]